MSYKQYTPAFKVEVVLEVLREEKGSGKSRPTTISTPTWSATGRPSF